MIMHITGRDQRLLSSVSGNVPMKKNYSDFSRTYLRGRVILQRDFLGSLSLGR